MALRADFDVQIVLHRRACLKAVAARAGDVYFRIIRVNFRFHFLNGLLLFDNCAKTQFVIISVFQMKKQAERFSALCGKQIFQSLFLDVVEIFDCLNLLV